MPFIKGHKNYLTEESKLKMSKSRKGKMPKNLEYLHKLHNETNDWRKKLSEGMKGEKHWNWKGGITKLKIKLWHTFKYRQWRSDCFERDDYICQICGIKGGYLEVDHIKPVSFIFKENNIKTLEEALNCEELWNINNGRTLCKPCHIKYGINPRSK